MNDIRNFIFDLDGTLIDSTYSHVKAFNNAISQSTLSEKIDFDYEKMKGKRTNDVMIELGFDRLEAERLTKIKQESYREYLLNGEVELFPDVLDCLNLLKNKDKNVYICTGASRESVEIILKKFGIDIYVDDFITGSDVSEAKPSPKILNTLITHNNLKKDECLFVEDSENGKMCGVKASVKTVIVNNESIKGDEDYHEFSDFYNKVKELM